MEAPVFEAQAALAATGDGFIMRDENQGDAVALDQ